MHVKHVNMVFMEHNVFSKTSTMYALVDLDLSCDQI